MSDVRAVPPNESFIIRVSLESRYGMCVFCAVSESALMHLPSAVSDRLMNLASSSVCPSDPDLLIRSEPARSTSSSLPAPQPSGVGC